ncbi:MAG: hypothetical protein EOO73_11960 [Myxococcales bacterium]|nr:MAG: hypothetical protein EOO73_11960 [Myxococcales bacterium]
MRIRHLVREDLLAQAMADGKVTAQTERSTQAEVVRLVQEGADVVLCTCSTLGDAAEATEVPSARVLRVDRPMAERAVALGRPILLVAATPTAMATATALLHEVSQPPRPTVRELMCRAAWERFQAGDHAGYASALAQQASDQAHPGDVIVMAQASMSSAAALILRSDVDVLTSPELGVRRALALLAG